MRAFQTFRRIGIVPLAGLFLTLGNGQLAWSQVSMPSISMPELSSPSMPSVSMPSLSGSSSTGTSSSGSSSTGTSSTESSLGSGLTATALLGLTDTTGLSTLSSLLGTDSSSDTTSSISTLSALLGSSSSSDLSSLSVLAGTTSNTSNTLLLTQIIEKLNEISNRLDEGGYSAGSSGSSAEAVTVAGTADADSSQVQVAASTTRSPGILRFRVNGYDISSSIKELYVSEPEADGTFLLTADRSYTADYKTRTETFFLLFTPSVTEQKNSGEGFSVTVQVLQDYENRNSFLYRLSQAGTLQAKKTGDLVSVILDRPDLKLDFLMKQK